MSEQTATDRLRELLDERGVEWKAHGYENHTWWSNNENVGWHAENRPCVRGLYVKVEAVLTPEQAIAATLGSGMCTLPETRVDHGSIEYNGVTEWRKCSACGEEILAYPAHFCPNCGRKVVDE